MLLSVARSPINPSSVFNRMGLVTPQHYGAVGDGITDDLTAFNSAIAACVSSVLMIPAGTYYLSAALSLTANISMFGVGDNSILYGAGIQIASGLSVSLRDFVIDLNGLQSTGIYTDDDCIDTIFERLKIKNATAGIGESAYGIRISCGRNIKVQNCTIENVDATAGTGIARGICLQAGAGAAPENIHVLNSHIENVSPVTDGDGIVFQTAIDGGRGLQIVGNSLINCYKSGIKVQDDGVIVERNYVYRNGTSTAGIRARKDGMSGLLIANNEIHLLNSSGSGISISGADGAGAEVVNNRINSTYTGIAAGATGETFSDAVICGNIVKSFTYNRLGIDLRGTCNDFIVTGNVVKQLGSAADLVWGYGIEASFGFDGGNVTCCHNIIRTGAGGRMFAPVLIAAGDGHIVKDNSVDATTSATCNTSGTHSIAGQNTQVGTGNVRTFAADDATPSVNYGVDLYKTANVNPTTITNFDLGHAGQTITVLVSDINTTVSFTGLSLKGNGGVDWNPANGDFLVATFDGSVWYCEVYTI